MIKQSEAYPIVITGLGKRFGFVLAKFLLERNIPVIGTYRTYYPELAELTKLGAELYQCDFYYKHQVQDLIDILKHRYSNFRALIHNASDWLPDYCDKSLDVVMEKMMQVHVNVPYQLNHELSNKLVSNNTELGDIIHITDYVVEKGSKKHIAYAASKAALQNLTLSFASLLAPKIKVNSISPALVKFNEGDDVAYREKATQKALIEKEGGFDEMISAVEYILSNQYMTGRAICLDGGRHLK